MITRERVRELLTELAALRERASWVCQKTEGLRQIYREPLHEVAMRAPTAAMGLRNRSADRRGSQSLGVRSRPR